MNILKPNGVTCPIHPLKLCDNGKNFGTENEVGFAEELEVKLLSEVVRENK
jgi:hypothetical protein